MNELGCAVGSFGAFCHRRYNESGKIFWIGRKNFPMTVVSYDDRPNGIENKN